MRQLVDHGKLDSALAARYLDLYLAPADWVKHLNALYAKVMGDGRKSLDDRRIELRRNIAFSILISAHQRSLQIDRSNPEGLLHSSARWRQINERDWFADLVRVVRRDLEITGWRGQAASLGLVDPLEYAPYCRQAYNWLFERATADGWVTDESKPAIKEWCTTLVHTYGGVVISNLFVRHEDVLAKVVNWRTAYHVERKVFDVYTIDQAMKIKTAELQKTNPGLRKSLTVSSVS